MINSDSETLILGSGHHQIPQRTKALGEVEHKFSFHHKAQGEIQLLRNKIPIICSGYQEQTLCSYHDGNPRDDGDAWPFYTDQGYQEFREFPSSILLGHENEIIFLVGGRSHYKDDRFLNSTIFITIDPDGGSIQLEPGPRLPQPRSRFCFVKVNATLAILAGGIEKYGDHQNRDHENMDVELLTSLLYDIPNQMWIQGPDIKEGRRIKDCTVIQDIDENSELSYVVMAGGYYHGNVTSTELIKLFNTSDFCLGRKDLIGLRDSLLAKDLPWSPHLTRRQH